MNENTALVSSAFTKDRTKVKKVTNCSYAMPQGTSCELRIKGGLGTISVNEYSELTVHMESGFAKSLTLEQWNRVYHELQMFFYDVLLEAYPEDGE